MSKATYHVPQPGDNITFITDGGCLIKCTVARWDSKHGIVFDSVGFRYNIRDRSSIKLVESEKEETHQNDGPHFVYAPADTGIVSPAKHTTTLPTSFASEVERAQAIAGAEAEEKKRSGAAIDEMNRLADEIVALTNKRRDVMAANEDAEEDHQHRVDYLRSLRVRGE